MNISQTIGKTPLVLLQHSVEHPNVKIYAKLEGNNPAGSVKDRPAFNMLKQALKRGEVKQGETIIEATSGNTGIALAMSARLLGLNMVLVMPDNSTEERKKTMRAFGAELILTPAKKTIEYSRDLAFSLAQEKGYLLLNQFDNPDNWKAHYMSTGPEIWRDTAQKVTHFVSAMGTTGTIMGVSSFLKEQNEKIQIIGAQPSDGSSIPGIRRWSPEQLPAIFDPKKVDEIRTISEEEAKNGARELAREEGIFAGVSAGGAYALAKQVATEIQEGIIVFIVCDRGDRYLSTDLYN